MDELFFCIEVIKRRFYEIQYKSVNTTEQLIWSIPDFQKSTQLLCFNTWEDHKIEFIELNSPFPLFKQYTKHTDHMHNWLLIWKLSSSVATYLYCEMWISFPSGEETSFFPFIFCGQTVHPHCDCTGVALRQKHTTHKYHWAFFNSIDTDRNEFQKISHRYEFNKWNKYAYSTWMEHSLTELFWWINFSTEFSTKSTHRWEEWAWKVLWSGCYLNMIIFIHFC